MLRELVIIKFCNFFGVFHFVCDGVYYFFIADEVSKLDRIKIFFLILAIFTTNTHAAIKLRGASSEVDKDLLVGDPVYMRDGVINLTYFLKVKNNQYAELKDRTVNQYGKVIKINKLKFNIFQKDMVVDCNAMSGYWLSDTWWNDNRIVLKNKRNALGQQLLAQRGIITPPITLEPNSDAQRAALYQCDNALKLKKYN
ncbi:hypothetical protein [Acinetobacter seifertii]|uniref:hypothetical protein n=1 Tax=Acinetobacter seifertii TaxID=1530123 RepID=UPI00124C7E45|nr:hypothetical protein [Acinetobacter seifertii]